MSEEETKEFRICEYNGMVVRCDGRCQNCEVMEDKVYNGNYGEK